jgi:hypothetical protein
MNGNFGRSGRVVAERRSPERTVNYRFHLHYHIGLDTNHGVHAYCLHRLWIWFTNWQALNLQRNGFSVSDMIFKIKYWIFRTCVIFLDINGLTPVPLRNHTLQSQVYSIREQASVPLQIRCLWPKGLVLQLKTQRNEDNILESWDIKHMIFSSC